MNKLINMVVLDLKKDKSIYISFIIVLLISLIFGSIFILILKSKDKVLINDYITNFFTSISDNTYKYNYLNNLLVNIIPIIILFIFSLTVIGIPISIIILFIKGFNISFTITSIIYVYRFKGILLSILYIFPVFIINLIVYYLCTYYSFKLSILILNNIINNKTKVNKYIKKNIFITLLCISIIFITTLIETYIMPLLINIII